MPFVWEKNDLFIIPETNAYWKLNRRVPITFNSKVYDIINQMYHNEYRGIQRGIVTVI